MSHNTFDQCNNLVPRRTAADGTVAAERAPELLDTALAPEVLQAIVGGLRDVMRNIGAALSTSARAG